MQRPDFKVKPTDSRLAKHTGGHEPRLLTRLMWLMLLASGFLAFVTALSATAEDENLKRWVPAVALEASIYGHTGKGNISSSELVGPRVSVSFPTQSGDFSPVEDPNNPGTFIDVITYPLASRQNVLNALVGVSFELMAPAFTTSGMAPRLFMDLNISETMGAEVGLAIDADPGDMSLPFPRSPSTVIGEGAILGRGSKITVQNQGPQIHAGIGTAFTFHFGPETIRIKPSFVYSRIKQTVSTKTRRAVRLNNANGARVDIDDPNDFRLLLFDDSIEEVYHGIGPALEIEYETGGRVGPFDVALFIKGHASRLFGDLTTDAAAANPAYPEEQVFYKYSQDRWTYRVGTGVRFRLGQRERGRQRRR
jgi:hypothetical protein